MPVIIPEEEELRSRIIRHIHARPTNPLVAVAWRGYIGSLLEWGVIDPHVHSRLVDLLPDPGRMEVVEILMGTDYVDEHPELRDEVGQNRVA